MNNLLNQTKEICQKYGIKPARARGQNFLVNEEVYDDIMQAADLDKKDVVLEVGPGLGFLTERLVDVAKKVIAVELDRGLVNVLENRLFDSGKREAGSGKRADIKTNVEIINEDILNFRFPHPDSRIPFKIVANLPYNITSIFLRKFLTAENKPEMMVLMLQKEVAERICAKPGKMSLLSVSVQYYANPKIIRYVAKEDFWPEPEVESAVIKIDVNTGPSTRLRTSPVENEEKFFQMVKFGFSARRKMLKNNLSAGYKKDQKTLEKALEIAGLSSKARAQDLSVEDWRKLFGVIVGNVL